jgi:hypothetical protein
MQVQDIKTILEALYDSEKSQGAEITGEEAATLAQIQAALQPHIITDDPAGYAVGYLGEDSMAAANIPAEQAAPHTDATQDPAAAAAAAAGAKPDSSSSSSSANEALTTAAAAPAPVEATSPSKATSSATSATGAEATATSDTDEEAEFEYIEEEVEVDAEDADADGTEDAVITSVEYIDVDQQPARDAADAAEDSAGNGKSDLKNSKDASAKKHTTDREGADSSSSSSSAKGAQDSKQDAEKTGSSGSSAEGSDSKGKAKTREEQQPSGSGSHKGGKDSKTADSTPQHAADSSSSSSSKGNSSSAPQQEADEEWEWVEEEVVEGEEDATTEGAAADAPSEHKTEGADSKASSPPSGTAPETATHSTPADGTSASNPEGGSLAETESEVEGEEEGEKEEEGEEAEPALVDTGDAVSSKGEEKEQHSKKNKKNSVKVRTSKGFSAAPDASSTTSCTPGSVGCPFNCSSTQGTGSVPNCAVCLPPEDAENDKVRVRCKRTWGWAIALLVLRVQKLAAMHVCAYPWPAS